MTDPLEPNIGHLWLTPIRAPAGWLGTGHPERLYGLVGDPFLPWNKPNRSPFDRPYTSGLVWHHYFEPTDWNELIAPRLTRLLRAARHQWWRTQDAWHVLIGTDTVCDDG